MLSSLLCCWLGVQCATRDGWTKWMEMGKPHIYTWHRHVRMSKSTETCGCERPDAKWGILRAAYSSSSIKMARSAQHPAARSFIRLVRPARPSMAPHVLPRAEESYSSWRIGCTNAIGTNTQVVGYIVAHSHRGRMHSDYRRHFWDSIENIFIKEQLSLY